MKAYLYLDEVYLGELTVESVRGHETWMFAYDADYLKVPRPMLDPELAQVTGPQYSQKGGPFGFLADVSPDRWGRKLIRRGERAGSGRPVRRCGVLPLHEGRGEASL